MKRYRGRVLVLLCFGLLAIRAAWFFEAQKPKQMLKVSADEGPNWQRINRAARNANPADPASVGALADEIFKAHGIDPTMSGDVKSRLVTSETDYQNGKGPGISEEQVANTVNQLADGLNTPQWAHTNDNEVKKLRMRMITLNPDLIGRGPRATRDDSHPHFAGKMSPLEAFHVTATLVHQKVFNPEFQFAPGEKPENSQTGKESDVPHASGNSHGERSREMLNLIQQGANTMSATDLLNRFDGSLDTLGIRH